MRWDPIQTKLEETVSHFRFLDLATEGVLRFTDVIELWKADSEEGWAFRDFTTQTICDSTFEALRWETPAVDASRITREFEFVLVDSPRLSRRPSRREFTQQFASCGADETVVVFPNIGRDSILVVPCPRDEQNRRDASRQSPDTNLDYCHLASFLRTAPIEQSDRMWVRIGEALANRISERPVWLNTAGGGVAWLHVRLDDRPKYYSYSPFKAN